MSSHLDESGKAFMVDVSGKSETGRTAVAEGYIFVSEPVLAAIRENAVKKGDALGVARVAGILAVKNTPRVIPLCHNIPISGCDIQFTLEEGRIRAVCSVVCHAQTGAEMEALSGVSTALLTIYDMCKSIDNAMEINNIRLLKKTGGKSGDYVRRPEGG